VTGRNLRLRAMAACLVLLASVVWVLMRSTPESRPAPEPPPVPAPPTHLATNRDSVPEAMSEPHAPPASVVLASPGAPAILVRDMDGGAPVSGASFVVTPATVVSRGRRATPIRHGAAQDAGSPTGADPMRVTTDGTGAAVLPGPGAWSLRIEGDEFRRVGPDLPITAEGTTEVWVFRRAVVRGAVLLAGGSLPTGLVAEVVGYPTADAPKGFGSRAEDVGSARWIEVKFGKMKRTLWRTPVREGRYEIEVPAIGQFTLVAAAPRHVSDSRSLDLRPPASAVIEGVDFVLRAAPPWRVRVVDEQGRPIERANVLRYSLKQVPTADARVENERLAAAAGGGGASMWSNDRTGLTTYVRMTRETTGKSGEVEISDCSATVPTRQSLLVTADGYAGVLLTDDAPGGLDDRSVVLRKITDADGFYRVTWHGVPLTGEVGFSIGACIDEAHSTGNGSGMKIQEGRVPRNAFEIGREYYLSLSAAECGPRSGRVTITGSDNIEISGLPNY